jgi:hypothetical protein
LWQQPDVGWHDLRHHSPQTTVVIGGGRPDVRAGEPPEVKIVRTAHEPLA